MDMTSIYRALFAVVVYEYKNKNNSRLPTTFKQFCTNIVKFVQNKTRATLKDEIIKERSFQNELPKLLAENFDFIEGASKLQKTLLLYIDCKKVEEITTKFSDSVLKAGDNKVDHLINEFCNKYKANKQPERDEAELVISKPSGKSFEYPGHYLCYYVSMEFETINEFKLEIFSDNKAKITTAQNREYEGQFDQKDPNLYFGKFYYPQASTHYFRFFLSDWSTSSPVSGIYAGIEPQHNDVMQGRLVLTPYPKDADVSFENYTPASYDLNSFLPSEMSIRDKFPGLINFFLGADFPVGKNKLALTHVDSHSFFEKVMLQPEDDSKKRVAGIWLNFRLSESGTSIRCHPIRIYKDGRIVGKSSTPGTLHFGKVVFLRENYVTLLFSRRMEGQKESFFATQHTYPIGALSKDQIRWLQGGSIGLTSKPSVRVGRDVLVNLNHFHSVFPQFGAGIQWEDDESIWAKIASFEVALPQVDKSLWDRTGTEETQPVTFEDLCHARLGGLGKFLLGDSNNVIKMSNRVNSDLSRHIDYGDLFFSAACYMAEQLKTNNLPSYQYKQAYITFSNQLKRAFLHGFDRKSLLQQELLPGNRLHEFKKEIQSFIDIDNMKLLELPDNKHDDSLQYFLHDS